MATFRNEIRSIQNGQPVDAGNTNRPIDDVQANVRYLYDLILAAQLGEALFARNVVVSSDCLQGMAVYWNNENSRYEPALAAASSVDGVVELADTAIVAGVVFVKHSTTTADLLTLGRAPLDISAALDVAVAPGRYFLSGITPGNLTQQQPDVGIGVLHYEGSGNVIVNPDQRNFLDDHKHFRIELTARPAGTVTMPVEGGTHSINTANANLPGWLPADHASFDGKAPDGAKFGYNISQDAALNAVWPPIPLSAASVFVDRPHLLYDATQNWVGGTLMDSRIVVIDDYGIWWMSNCYNNAPWDTDYENDGNYGSSLSYDDTCGPEHVMRIWLYFTQATYANDRNVVTRLTPQPGSPISLTNCNGDPAEVGDLFLDIDLQYLLDDDTGLTGSNVVKGLDGLTLQTGHVTEGLIEGANVSLSSTQQRTSGATTIHQGLVTVTVDLEATERELTPTIVKLNSALERTSDDIPYIGLPASHVSSVRLRYNVPLEGLPANPRFFMRLLLLGTTNGTLPALTLTYKVIPDPGNSSVDLDELVEEPLTITTTGAITADHIVRKESSIGTVTTPAGDYEVQPGDTILVTIARGSDAYSGEVGLVRMQAVIRPEA